MKNFIITTLIISSSFLLVAEGAFAQGAQCRRENYALRKETAEERKAEGNLNRALRNVESLLRRLQQEINKMENIVERYEIQKERLNESTARQVDALENRRVTYAAQITELVAVLAFCQAEDFFDDFLGLPDRSCNPERINTQIVRITKRIADTELRISSAHDRRDRYLASYDRQFQASVRAEQTRIDRARARWEEAQNKVPPFQAAFDQAAAERAAADAAYQACIAG